MKIAIRKGLLRQIRMRKGFTIRGLADKANLNDLTVFKLENYKTNPTPTTARKICEALEVGFDEIFEIKDGE